MRPLGFGYASLIWRPEFAADETGGAAHGWHRALRMRSRINRGGTPGAPGLVFGAGPAAAAAWSTASRVHAPSAN